MSPCEPSASIIKNGQASRNIRPYIAMSGLRFTKALKLVSVTEVAEETVDNAKSPYPSQSQVQVDNQAGLA